MEMQGPDVASSASNRHGMTLGVEEVEQKKNAAIEARHGSMQVLAPLPGHPMPGRGLPHDEAFHTTRGTERVP